MHDAYDQHGIGIGIGVEEDDVLAVSAETDAITGHAHLRVDGLSPRWCHCLGRWQRRQRARGVPIKSGNTVNARKAGARARTDSLNPGVRARTAPGAVKQRDPPCNDAQAVAQ